MTNFDPLISDNEKDRATLKSLIESINLGIEYIKESKDRAEITITKQELVSLKGELVNPNLRKSDMIRIGSSFEEVYQIYMKWFNAKKGL